ncbi:MAG TPA: hypothetical protein VFJ26_18485 [Dyella sp.]|nr:hypothetical protein [Dyella sp.]HET7332789.1 hypothetical protein [Dyella sp.]
MHSQCASLRHVTSKDAKAVVAALQRMHCSATVEQAATELVL